MRWKLPPSIVSSLQVVQAASKETVAAAEGEAKSLLEEIQDLTLVRIGQSFHLMNCVQLSSLLCLNSHCLSYLKVR